MDPRFYRTIIILVAMAAGYSVLGNNSRSFSIDLGQLKGLLLYILLGGGAWALWSTLRPRRRPNDRDLGL